MNGSLPLNTRTHLAYTQYLNGLYGRSGHLWQNRFNSCILDEEYYWTALRYIERNPVCGPCDPFAFSFPAAYPAGGTCRIVQCWAQR